MQPQELIVAAQHALVRGDVTAAAGQAVAAVKAGGGPAAREFLGGLLLFDDDIEGARPGSSAPGVSVSLRLN